MMASSENWRRTCTFFSINGVGTVSISQRINQEPPSKNYDKLPIIDVEWDKIEFEVSIQEDQDGIFVELGGHHIEVDPGEEDTKAYHTHTKMKFSIADVKKLHAFLEFLITSGIDGISNN
jgi:hypothetical protein